MAFDEASDMSALAYRSFVNRDLPIRERACESKAMYVTRGEARQRVRAAGHIDPSMKPYRCRYCSMWHLGHRHRGRPAG
jgi:DNA-directed RNA polymerase subunit RPC12/RpoP